MCRDWVFKSLSGPTPADGLIKYSKFLTRASYNTRFALKKCCIESTVAALDELARFTERESHARDASRALVNISVGLVRMELFHPGYMHAIGRKLLLSGQVELNAQDVTQLTHAFKHFRLKLDDDQYLARLHRLAMHHGIGGMLFGSTPTDRSVPYTSLDSDSFTEV